MKLKSMPRKMIRRARENVVRAWAVLSNTYKQIYRSDVQMLAGSLAFTTVISLVPLLAVSLSVFSAFGGLESLLKKIEPFILNNLVEASGAQLSKGFRRSVHRVHSGALGAAGVLGLLLASTKLFHDMETAVQRVWQIKNKRSLVRRLLVYWLVMFFGPLALASALGLLGSKDLGLIRWLPKEAITITFVFIAFSSIYKFVPSRPVSWRSSLLSALMATTGVALAQEFYAEVMKNILRYNKIYGSLASFPIFLLWILLLWWICLAGCALCAVLERRRDHRLGLSKPGH